MRENENWPLLEQLKTWSFIADRFGVKYDYVKQPPSKATFLRYFQGKQKNYIRNVDDFRFFLIMLWTYPSMQPYMNWDLFLPDDSIRIEKEIHPWIKEYNEVKEQDEGNSGIGK